MPRIIGNPTVTPMAISDWNQTDPTKADFIKNKPNVYTKYEVNAELNKKVSKEDISNVYKFMGSVNTFDDLPMAYPLIPNGVPTFYGEPCGTYDEETHTVTIDNVPLTNGDRIIVPIVPISITAGNYSGHLAKHEAYIGELCTYIFTVQELNEGTIDHIEIFPIYEEEMIEFSSNSMGWLWKVVDTWVSVYGEVSIPVGAYDNGVVYNVLEDGMNYAWTGTDWDALGSNSSDSDHRENKNNPHSVTANQVGAYTKQEVDSKLSNKVNKSDMTNVYKFMGSVDTFDDLFMKYKIIPKGNPTLYGVEIGTYDAEKGEVHISEEFLNDEGVISVGYEVSVAIEPITLPPGYYRFGLFLSIPRLGDGHPINIDNGTGVWKTETEIIINEILLGDYGWFNYGDYTLGNITKFPKSCVEERDDCSGYGVIYHYTKYVSLTQGDVYNVLEDGMNYGWTGSTWDALGGEHKDIEARESIEQISVELHKKANKEDVVSAYKFMGSVETFEDLPKCYEFIPRGNPTVDGVEVGTYDAENRTITLNEPMILDEYVIRIPVDVTVAKGRYCIDPGTCPDMEVLDKTGYECVTQPEPLEIDAETKITAVYIGYPYSGEEFSGTYTLGGLYNFYVNNDGMGDYIYVSNGDVYEVKESGLSYGWTGSTWDALGTSHVDQEARDGIENLETQIGKVDEALDLIREIQNSLIGGDSV